MIKRKFRIAVAPSRKSQAWHNEMWTWEKLTARLSAAKNTGEKLEDYLNAPREEQSAIKDVGGFVGGYLMGGRRLRTTVQLRSMLALDADYGGESFVAWDLLCLNIGCVACMYTTHKHRPGDSRYRILIPLSRDVSPDEYEAVSRFLVDELERIDDFDDSTYEPHRLMFWPSRATDGEFRFASFPPERDGVMADDSCLLDPDAVLERHPEWKDASTWPQSSRTRKEIRRESLLPGDPRQKPGLIGAFCRAYDIPSAIATFLPDVYDKVDDRRYTFRGGTSACGLVLLPGDAVCYSHHSTDPAAGGARNSFDLVRIHLFGAQDSNAEDGCHVSHLPSYKAMMEYIQDIPDVRKEAVNAVAEEFASPATPAPASPVQTAPEDESWKEKMNVGKGGVPQATFNNVSLILENDPELRGALGLNRFTGRITLIRDVLPWRRVNRSIRADEYYRDTDDTGLRAYIESRYRFDSKDKILSTVEVVAERHAFHPVRDYLDSLQWDGVQRVETLLVDYLGAEDCPYVRSITRKTLLGAVSRVRRPGCKFDNVLVLVGGQGLGKSTLIAKLSRGWFSDSLNTVQGREAYEGILGFWLIELSELASLKKAEMEATKQFLSKCEDSYRAAYAHRVETHCRQCIFIGTTNTQSFLRDPSGNRRFWPVDVRGGRLSVWEDLTDSVIDQIWAEVQHMYDAGEDFTYLKPEEEAMARREQAMHEEEDEREGIISAWLDIPIPQDFSEWSTYKRHNYYANPEFHASQGLMRRERVSIAEVYVECLNGRMDARTRQSSNDIVSVLLHLGWRKGQSGRTVAYGPQTMYYRPNTDNI